MTLSIFWFIVVPVGLFLVLLFTMDATTPSNKTINHTSSAHKKRKPVNEAAAPKGMMLNPMYGRSNSPYDDQDMWIHKPPTPQQIAKNKRWEQVERDRCKEMNVYHHKDLPIPNRLGSPRYHKEFDELNVPQTKDLKDGN